MFLPEKVKSACQRFSCTVFRRIFMTCFCLVWSSDNTASHLRCNGALIAPSALVTAKHENASFETDVLPRLQN